MNDYRIRFSKLETAVYISHLDLMRTMQRVFVRAGLKIRHTEGFNPHPRMVFAVPLPVGCGSRCELMDFTLTEPVDMERIPVMLNAVMPAGICVTEAYVPERRFPEIKWFSLEGRLDYDSGVPENATEALRQIFQMETLVLEKRTKKGMANFDVIPCVKEISFHVQSETCVGLSAVVSAQDPSLNPELITAAIRLSAPQLEPNYAVYTRIETFDSELSIFR